MGTWGFGLFQDDQAADLRRLWQDLYALHQDPGRATQEILETQKSSLDDPDIGPELWVVLAVLKHRYGCLDAALRERAIGIMDSGEGLVLWQEQGVKEVRERRKTYAKVRAELLSPQQPLKKVKRPKLEPKHFHYKQLVCYTAMTGMKVLLWVAGCTRHKGQEVPAFMPLDWHGMRPPAEDEIRRLKPLLLATDVKAIEFDRKFLAEHEGPSNVFVDEMRKNNGPQRRFDHSVFGLHKFDEPAFDRGRIQVLPGEWEWKPPGEPYIGGTSTWFEFESRLYDRFGIKPPREWPRPPIQARSDLERLSPPAAQLVAPPAPENASPGKYNYNLAHLGRARGRPQPGDLFAMYVISKGWVFGRVIRTDTGADFPIPLVYIYEPVVAPLQVVPPLSPRKLLFPPRFLTDSIWTMGYVKTVEKRPLSDEDVLPYHELWALGDQYEDEFGRPIRKPLGPCSLAGVGGTGVLNAYVSIAFGLPVNE